MPEFNLEQISKITGGKIKGSKTQIVDLLEIDSRRISNKDRSIFIAIKGERHNGHLYINDLYERGLRNFLIEDPSIINSKINDANFVIVPDSVEALQKLAAHYRRQLSMPFVAITGSNGKTVVKEWLFQCLSYKSIVSRSPRSYNSQIGVPLSIWMLNEHASWAIIEAGISRTGEMQKLEKTIGPDYGIITNLGPAHQENFKNLEQKAREKLTLFKHAKIIYYCYDHEIIREAISADRILSSKQLISWSKHCTECFLSVTGTEKKKHYTLLTLSVAKETYKLTIPFTDDASLENCLHIITFLLHNKNDIQAIQHALKDLTPVAMRLEQVRGINNSTIINDSYNSDYNSLRIALDYLSMQKQHKKYALILSDIQQSGQTSNELYSGVMKLLSSYQIDQLIAIGPHLSNFRNLPAGTIRYETTGELLNSLSGFDLSDHSILIKGAREFGFEEIVKALSEKKHTTVLEINLNHLVSNLNYFRNSLQAGTKIMVMVKALSYGSGSYEIASLLQHEKVDYLGVAFADEGVELRQAGITLPILIMLPSADSYEKLIEYQLEPEIYSFSGLEAISKVISASQIIDYPVQIKLDSGMHRLGFMPDEIPELAKRLSTYRNIKVKALFSHLAASDSPDEDAFTTKQIQIFQDMYNTLSNHIGYKPLRHIVNSAGIERFPQAHYEMVRLGIGLHGISGIQKKLKTISTLKTQISQIKSVTRNDTIGYNRRGRVDRDSSIAIIPVGYADGLNRKLGNHNGQVVIKDQYVPFVGDICMDMCMIDVTGLKVREGDEVIVFGEKNPIHELAKKIDTIPYEVLTSISSRVNRIYINE